MLILARTLWLAAAVLALAVSAPAAQPTGAAGGVSIDPLMVRGPATAPVTIVEFSDYQ